jgi:glutamate decarboxylase
VFTVNYLGSDQLSFTLNFSKSAIQGAWLSCLYLCAYVEQSSACTTSSVRLTGRVQTELNPRTVRLGKSGYRAIMTNLTATADYIAEEIEKMGNFKILSDRSGKGLPLVAWKMVEERAYDEFAIGSLAHRSEGQS